MSGRAAKTAAGAAVLAGQKQEGHVQHMEDKLAAVDLPTAGTHIQLKLPDCTFDNSLWDCIIHVRVCHGQDRNLQSIALQWIPAQPDSNPEHVAQ
jgi:hypothetical protein